MFRSQDQRAGTAEDAYTSRRCRMVELACATGVLRPRRKTWCSHCVVHTCTKGEERKGERDSSASEKDICTQRVQGAA